MNETFYYASNDAMFERIFGDEHDIEPLIFFLQAVLDLSPKDYTKINLVDPILALEYPEDKHGILDVRMRTVSGKEIDIEIQLNNVAEARKHADCYLILISNSVPSRKSESYRGNYRLRNSKTGSELSLIEIVTLELSKLPQDSDGTALWDWLRFVGAKRQEELEMLAEKKPQVGKAVAKLVELNADERARMIADSLERARANP